MSDLRPHRYRRALVIANPWAGRGRGRERAEALARGLGDFCDASDLHLTTARGDGGRRVREAAPDTDLVVSVGGDGTLSEVLDGLRGRDAAVAQLPMGTANVLAMELRLPRRVEPMLAMLRAGRTTELDTADVAGRLSFLCTGLGFDASAVQEVEARRRGPIRKLHYVTASLAALRRYRAPSLSLELDGTPIEGTFGYVLIANLREYGAVFHLSSEGRRDDGRFEVYALRRAGLGGLLRLGLTGLLRELPGRATEFWQAADVRVSSPEPVPYQIDGDLGGVGTEVHVRYSGERFRVVVP